MVKEVLKIGKLKRRIQVSEITYAIWAIDKFGATFFMLKDGDIVATIKEAQEIQKRSDYKCKILRITDIMDCDND